MKRKFILSGENIEIDVISMNIFNDFIDITPVGSKWREIVHGENQKLDLLGILPNGEKINSSYLVKNILEDGTIVIEPWPDIPSFAN